MRAQELIDILANANPSAEVYFYYYDEYGVENLLSVDVVNEYSNIDDPAEPLDKTTWAPYIEMYSYDY